MSPDLRANRQQHGIETTVGLFKQHILDLAVEQDADVKGFQASNLLMQYIARQTIGRDTEMQHAACYRACLVNFHRMTAHRQMPGSGQSARPGADDQHALATGGGGLGGPAVFQGQVAEEALDRMDADAAVQFIAIAGRLAGVVADPAVDGGERIISDQALPRSLIVARLS